jgi:ribosome-binding protein aMBF1 (putative translation factor)
MTTTKTKKAKLYSAAEVHAEFRQQPGYQEVYDALEDEFAIMEFLMKARSEADLSQSEVARRMGTKQSAIARLEAGGHRASLATLHSYAQATGHRLRITLEPAMPRSGTREDRARKLRPGD